MCSDTLLPLEVIREIFSHVDDDDNCTLSACSQTSSWLRLDAQKRIFTSVRLEYLMGRDPASHGNIWLVDLGKGSRNLKFLSAITHVPRLGTFVRQLSLTTTQSKSRMQLTTASLLEILPRLTLLKEFVFDKPNSGPIKFAHLSIPIQDVIRNTLAQLKGLTCIDLSGLLDIPPALICHSPQLVSLSLVSVSSDNVGIPVTRSGSVSPRSLKLCNTVPWTTCSEQLKGFVQMLQRSNSPLSLSKLETVIIETHHTAKPDVEYLLSCAPTKKLRNLALSRPQLDAYSNPNHLIYPDPSIDLQSFRSLTKLCLSMGQLYVTLGYADAKTPLPWVANILKSLPVLRIDTNPPLSLELDGTIFSSSHHLVERIPWGLATDILICRRAEFKAIRIRLTVISQKSDGGFASSSAQKAIEALKSHPSIRVLEEYVNLQYLKQVIDI